MLSLSDDENDCSANRSGRQYSEPPTSRCNTLDTCQTRRSNTCPCDAYLFELLLNSFDSHPFVLSHSDDAVNSPACKPGTQFSELLTSRYNTFNTRTRPTGATAVKILSYGEVLGTTDLVSALLLGLCMDYISVLRAGVVGWLSLLFLDCNNCKSVVDTPALLL